MPENAPAPDFQLGTLQPRGTRRLVYHSDPSNATHHLPDPTTPEDLRRIVRLYAQEGQIDTFVQEIFSQAMTHFWWSDTCPYDVRPHHQRFVPMMDDGVMPVEVYIDESHKQGIEFIAGWRMNDRHGHHPEFFKKLSEEKPDWILDLRPTWDQAVKESHKYGCALDFSVEAVRQWYLAIMTDMAQRFDIDGFELNFMRLPECFPPAAAAESHPIMTGFIRDIRNMLNAKKPGLILGARVPQQMSTCHHFGFNVPTWMAEGLIDYVSPSDWQMTDINEPYEDFVSPARQTDCLVYPQMTTWTGFRLPDIEMTPARYRAAATNFYGAGCDGLCPLQFDFHWSNAKIGTVMATDSPVCTGPDPEYLHYLHELRSTQTVAAAGDREYVFVPLWREDIKTYQKEAIVLSRGKPGSYGKFRCRLCEKFPPKPSTDGGLTFFPVGLADGDQLAIDINGTSIPPQQLQWRSGETPACTIPLSDPPFVYGDNYLGVELIEPASGVEGEITIERVECLFRMG